MLICSFLWSAIILIIFSLKIMHIKSIYNSLQRNFIRKKNTVSIFIKPFSTVLYSNKYDTDNSSDNKSNEQNAIYMSNKASIISKLENMKINQLKLITKRFNVKPKDLRKAELIDLCTSLILNNLNTTDKLKEVIENDIIADNNKSDKIDLLKEENDTGEGRLEQLDDTTDSQTLFSLQQRLSTTVSPRSLPPLTTSVGDNIYSSNDTSKFKHPHGDK